MQYSVGQIIDNRYELVRLIGSGSFGEVWVAMDKETDIEVALKIYISMDQQGLADFKKEFQLSFNLNHTNLLHSNYLGSTSDDNRAYLVMPLCPEGSVSKYIGDIDEHTLWRFIMNVSSGLAYLHDQHPPLIHQDIKPDNILISKNGDFVISDFGISKQLRTTLRRSIGHQYDVSGSVSYMGPERFSKNCMPLKASDIWSLGATIYELAVGDLPFCGMGGGMQQKGAEIPELPDKFSNTLNMVMMSCLAKETWDRPTAHQLEDFAGRILAGENPAVTWNLIQPVDNPVKEVVSPAGMQTVLIDVNDVNDTGNINTRKSKDNVGGKTVIQASSVVDTPAVNSEQYTNIQSEKETISVFVWIITIIVGLIAGFLINFFI